MPVAPSPATRSSRRNYQWLFAFAFVIAATAIGFAVYQNFSHNREPKIVLLSQSAPFSGLPGRENYPAFSPDGKLLTFVWNGGAGDNFDVYVKQIGAGAPVRLTDTTADEIHPTFSPDGSRVAFVRTFEDRSEVFFVPALGGAERKVCDLTVDRSRLSFSPDGRFLAVADSEPREEREGIFLVEVATGAKRRLTDTPEFAADNSARFSPDGSKLAFLRNFNNVTDEVFVVSSTGDAPERQLTFDKTTIPGLTWSADGERIIYASRITALTTSLRQISTGGGASELIVTNNNNVTNPAVSADGQTLAFVEESFKTNILQLNGNTPAANVAPVGYVSARKLVESSRDDNSPTFSPDNRQIAFVSNRTGNFEIWIADADGKRQRQLTGSTQFADEPPSSPASSTPPAAPSVAAGSPRFSLDGKMIAYDAQTNGNSDIFVVSTDGGTPRRLTFDESQEVLPSWSADGKWIYFSSNRAGNFNLWKIALAGGEPAHITKHGGFESAPAPDGNTIFYTKERGVAGLWQVPVDGGEEIPVAELGSVGYWRYWTVTQTGIYFVAPASSPPYSIKFYDFTNRQLTETATTDKPPIWTYPGLSASSDGKTILYSEYAQNASSIILAKF